MSSASHVQVIIASGPDDPKRVVLGLALAASAAAANTVVHVFFAMDGAKCLVGDVCAQTLVDGYPSVAELLESVEQGGGSIEYCPHCLPSGCTPRFGAQVRQSACGCSGAPSGLASYGVHLADRATVVF